jgi:transposase-like protein
MAFLKQFPDDDACWSHLERVRWPDGPVCLKCGNVGPTMKCGRAHYRLCKACNAKFTVAMGTPLEGTQLPMRTWFTALYLLAVSRGCPASLWGGISALARRLHDFLVTASAL